MNNNEPILSICIPTYNRSEALRQSLERYVSCEGFDDSVEIVISDNASTDNTGEIAAEYAMKFKNIKYYRNETNVKDSNFELALKRGTGRYLKLQNDATLFDVDALVYMKDCISRSDTNRPIFFTNDFIYTKFKGQAKIECNSFDEFISALSTYVTAISCFGVWKEQLSDVHNFTKYTELMLNQDDWTYQLLEKYGKCTLFNKHYYNVLPKNGGGYHWFKIHLDNYYKIMQPYIDKGLIGKKTVKKDKKNLLFHFMPELKHTYVYPVNGWAFEKKGTFRYLWKYYKKEWYFYALIIIYPLAFIVLNPIHYGKNWLNKLIARKR
ncbi:MAG: glycosyltransferase family 2 protein [Lachnospira sp.]